MSWTLQTPPCFVASTIRIVVDEADHVIADVRQLDNQDEALANARLIAAAPELLEACQWALNTLRDAVACPDGCPEELEAALTAAIAKAEGRRP